jgi:hypothetical protein
MYRIINYTYQAVSLINVKVGKVKVVPVLN